MLQMRELAPEGKLDFSFTPPPLVFKPQINYCCLSEISKQDLRYNIPSAGNAPKLPAPLPLLNTESSPEKPMPDEQKTSLKWPYRPLKVQIGCTSQQPTIRKVWVWEAEVSFWHQISARSVYSALIFFCLSSSLTSRSQWVMSLPLHPSPTNTALSKSFPSLNFCPSHTSSLVNSHLLPPGVEGLAWVSLGFHSNPTCLRVKGLLWVWRERPLTKQEL